MSWSDSYKLSWSDFKDEPNPRVSAVAITASGITFGFSIRQADEEVIDFSTKVHAHFYPEQSWYKAKQADVNVLAHEQLHFDITELFARKLRKEISRLKISNEISKDLKKAHSNVLKELERFQDTYDSETNFSRNSEIQAKWEISVQDQLNNLSDFKYTN